MLSSPPTSFMLPRHRMNASTNSSCAWLRRCIRPRLKLPSTVVPQVGQCSRVTASSSLQTGHRPITGCMAGTSFRDLNGSTENPRGGFRGPFLTNTKVSLHLVQGELNHAELLT